MEQYLMKLIIPVPKKMVSWEKGVRIIMKIARSPCSRLFKILYSMYLNYSSKYHLIRGIISLHNLIFFSMSKVMMQLTLLAIIHRSILDLHWIHLQMIIQNILMDCSTSMDLKILSMGFEI